MSLTPEKLLTMSWITDCGTATVLVAPLLAGVGVRLEI